ncbi:MAG: hypothetical protein IIA88_06260 [Bacteroidetes bacterium]|nr:hypothetical protein [Bacteroidota bacterium]
MKVIALLFTVLLIYACSSDRSKHESKAAAEDENTTEKKVADSLQNKLKISEDKIEIIITSFPALSEIPYLIKSTGTNYSVRILNPPDNKKKYATNFKKALNLGTYSADLGYINIYDHKQDMITYLTLVHQLADELKVGHFFDFQAIKRLATRSGGLDSLLIITTSNFEKMNEYLREQDRTHLSVLIITGGWLETVYILTQIAKRSNNEALRRRIGTQKIILDNIVLLLSFYQKDMGIGELLTDFKELQNLIDQVERIYTYKKPTYEKIDSMLVAIDHTTSIIKFPDGLFDKIAKTIEKIRKKIIE